MRKRQSRRKKVKDVNSQKKEKPLDTTYLCRYWNNIRVKIIRKEKLKLIFLTKKIRPNLVIILQEQIWILKEFEKGFLLKISKRDRQKLIKKKNDEITLLRKSNCKLSQRFITEKESFISGLRYQF